MGESVTVDGFVEQVMCSPRACLLSFAAGWSGLVVTIPASSKGKFGDPKSLERKNVRVRGVVEDRGGKPRIELADPSRLEVRDLPATGGGSRVVSAEAKPTRRTADGAARSTQPKTQVQVSGGLTPSSSKASSLGAIVRELEEEEAATGQGGGASSMAVAGLKERVAIQAHTIQTLEDELARLSDRLEDLETRPVAEPEPQVAEDLPGVEPWVVPARRGFTHVQPRTGWSADRLVRELGSPLDVQELSRDTAVWTFGPGQAVTVKRGRVVSASGF